MSGQGQQSASAPPPDDPLRRPRTPSPLPALEQQHNSPLSATSSRPVTPQQQQQRLARLRPLRSTATSPTRQQPLVQIDDDDDDDDGDEQTFFAGGAERHPHAATSSTPLPPLREEEMTIGRSYGATDAPASQHGGDADGSTPSRLRSIAGDSAVSSAAAGDVSAANIPRKPRQFSFKKRRTDGRSSVYSGSGVGANNAGGGKSNFLKRASMAAFGRAHPSAGARNMRRAHTISVNGGNGGGVGDSSEMATSQWERKPRIPSLMPAKPSSSSTPIPTVPFVVLCLVCFGEFSSAGVAGPFLFFQIASFNVGGEGEVAYWAGVVAAVFFFAQFLTSLLWASAAQQHGRRSVLLVSLLGNTVSLVLFGMSTNLRMAIAVRLAQGLFNGAVGVAKGAVRDLTDETSEGRAMAQLGFAWGFGSIIGPLAGGLLCNPVDKFPWLFGNNEFLRANPYVLPCLVVASFTATGAFLTLFIGPDGGPRTGAIRLPEKVDVERARAQAGESLVNLRHDVGGASFGTTLERTFTQQVDDDTGGPPSRHESDDDDDDNEGTIITNHRAGASGFEDARQRPYFARPRPVSRTAARHRSIFGGGSAYGYDGGMAASRAQESGIHAPPSVRESLHYPGGGRDRTSVMSTTQYAPDFEELGAGGTGGKARQPSFAQRFLLANDDAVLGLSDLWVAAAINDEAFIDDEDDDFGYDYGGGDEDDIDEERIDDSLDDGSDLDTRDSTGSMAFGHDEADEESPLAPRHLPPLNFARRHRLDSAGASSRGSRPFMRRLGSGGRVPSLYSNTGVEAQAAAAIESGVTLAGANATAYDPTLAGIPESGSMQGTLRVPSGAAAPVHGQYGGANVAAAPTAAPPSVFRHLPLVFIAHYALISLHSSTFDQVFMAYLVSPFKSGGLGLTATHYAELIAALAFGQVGFQFYFYPNVGPPEGRLSHLAMMRLGTCMYLPVYTLFAYLRAFLHPSTDVLVMAFMILFASLRLLANVCAFTALSVLINATTAPHLVPLANGLAQTVSSACRFVGPLVGGFLWAKGVEGGYELHEWPFNYHFGFIVAGLLGFTGFLLSWRIR